MSKQPPPSTSGATSGSTSSAAAPPPPQPSTSAPPPPPSTSAPPPTLLWSEEFDKPLDLVTTTNPNGSWRTHDLWQPVGQGAIDPGAGGNQCWMASPEQVLAGTRLNPFTVRDSVLSITARPTPPAVIGAAQGCRWTGGQIMSNTARPDMRFGHGYFEFRARLPRPGRGMFPALWFYAAYNQNPPEKARAEIDLLEVFGDPGGTPWLSTVHQTDSNGQGPQQRVLTRHDETSGWHTYGLYRTPTELAFYRDRQQVGSVSGPVAEFFAGCPMSIRMDYSMNAVWFDPANMSDGSTPGSLTLDVDYIRQYDRPF